jgi:Uma2 family endonuclease
MKFGVKEYWIVDLFKNRILVFFNTEDGPDVFLHTFEDEIPVHVLEGLMIDFKEIRSIIDPEDCGSSPQ